MTESLENEESSFSNLSVISPTSQLILQPFRRFIYVILDPRNQGHQNGWWSHSPTFPSLHLRHSSFSNPSVALPTSQLIVQPFRHFSFSNLSVTSPTSQLILQPFVPLPTSQLILQPFHCFTYVIGSSLASPGEPLMIHLLMTAFAFNFWFSNYVDHSLRCPANSESTPVVPWLFIILNTRSEVRGSNPAGADGFFQSVKILSMTSFGKEVKP